MSSVSALPTVVHYFFAPVLEAWAIIAISRYVESAAKLQWNPRRNHGLQLGMVTEVGGSRVLVLMRGVVCDVGESRASIDRAPRGTSLIWPPRLSEGQWSVDKGLFTVLTWVVDANLLDGSTRSASAVVGPNCVGQHRSELSSTSYPGPGKSVRRGPLRSGKHISASQFMNRRWLMVEEDGI
ncbi:hypothetical protein Tco_1226536 [Tanacetum coccineum]